MPPELAPYYPLITAFVERRLKPDEFESVYLTLFKNDPTFFPQEIYEILNGLFLDVDAYCHDPLLRGPHDIDEEELRKKARVAIGGLNEALARDEL